MRKTETSTETVGDVVTSVSGVHQYLSSLYSYLGWGAKAALFERIAPHGSPFVCI